MKDILSLFVSNDLALSFIKKTYRITLALMICNILYATSGLAEWYKYIEAIPARSHNIPHFLYKYTIWPAISMIDIFVIVIGSALNYQGFGHLMAAIKKEDDTSLAAAFKMFYNSYSLFLFSTILLILDFGYRRIFTSL